MLPIYFQHVTIWWTKASRGMPQAKRRAQIPPAFPLNAAEISAFGSTGGIQVITLREEEHFVPKVEFRSLPSSERIVIGAVTVSAPSQAGLQVRYHYPTGWGAPDRSHRPPVEFSVAPGHRARIAYNGRSSGYGIEWIYRLAVITVAVGVAPSADLFTTTPDHDIEDLADLF